MVAERDGDEGRQVVDGADAVEDARERGGVGDVAGGDLARHAREAREARVAGQRQHAHPASRRGQLPHEARAHHTGSAGDQDQPGISHRLLLHRYRDASSAHSKISMAPSQTSDGGAGGRVGRKTNDA